ncbi:hypothetical protein C1645_822471 [Glomus cerebriforme]|uniref:Crinkler family protein n=1 Tax=Glomus cerebriforme TaxID=658196 RepID=A0A397SYL8_9GLOM|nr:hypothetical protein C1645_822471 [Glomus cerebriforme]
MWDSPIPINMGGNVEDVQKYTTDEVIDFLRNENQNLIDDDFNILRRERVSGRAFLRMTKEDLINPPYNFHGGPALEIVEIVESLNSQKQPIAEYLSKRIKYDFDDQKLKKFWDALKHGKVEKRGHGEVLDLSEDVYYLLGKDEQGSNISTLFIRECYKDLYKMISENNNVRRWRITGNPGIGKTFFGFYLLHFLAKQNKTVIYHKLKKSPMLFSENGVFSYPEDNIHALKSYLANEEVWYIVDGREPMEYVAKTILVCSPQKSHYNQFDKLGVTIRYMPVWSWAEIDLCRDMLFRNLTQGYVRELYNKWGGIPRYTLFYALNDGQQASLQMAINAVNDKILNFIGETTDDNNSSHKIVHIRTNVPEVVEENEGERVEEEEILVEGEEVEEEEEVVGEPSLSNAPTVTGPDKGKGVVGKCNYKNQLQNFVEASSSLNDYATLRGTIFERIAHRKLLEGGSFRTRPLFATTVSCFGMNNSKLSIPKRDKLVFSTVDEVVPNRYCIPTQKNNASFDAFVSPDTFFQMTVAESHPIIKHGLEKYVNKNDNSDIKFYFVLPKEVYNSYQEQALHTTKGTVLKIRPPWVNRIKQYALEIELKL